MTLPQGWIETTIADVVQPMEAADPAAHPQASFHYIDIGSIDNTTQVIRDPKRMRGSEAPSRARRRVRMGDVLFATVRPYLKNIAQVPLELDGEVTSTGICVLRPATGIEPGYLFRRVVSADFIDAMTLASDGTMYPAIADRDVQAGSIAVPPAAEQRRIVAKLDALTARLARARVELDRASHLAARLRGPVVTAELQTLRGKGGSLSASELFKWSSGKFLPKKAQRDGTVPVYGGNGINGWHDQSNTSEPTLVVGRVGAQCGNVHLTTSHSWITDNAIFARSVSKDVDLSLALYVFQEAELIQHAAGTGQPYVNQEVLNRVPFPIANLDAQREAGTRISAALARADRLEAEASRARALVDQLEAAILARAFRGELVPQDPADEPASVLLDRIRAQRAAPPKVKRGHRAAVG